MVRWVCPRCGTMIVHGKVPGRLMCNCHNNFDLMAMDILSYETVDCGDFWLKVVPSWK